MAQYLIVLSRLKVLQNSASKVLYKSTIIISYWVALGLSDSTIGVTPHSELVALSMLSALTPPELLTLAELMRRQSRRGLIIGLYGCIRQWRN